MVDIKDRNAALREMIWAWLFATFKVKCCRTRMCDHGEKWLGVSNDHRLYV